MKDDITEVDRISNEILLQTVDEAELRKKPYQLKVDKLQKITGLCDTGRDVIVNCGLEISRLLSMWEFIGNSSQFKINMP